MNINQMSGVVISIATLLNAILVIINFYLLIKRSSNNMLKEKVKAIISEEMKPIIEDINTLKQHDVENFNDIKDIKAENLLIVSGLVACLDGLNQIGADGDVTRCKAELNKYLLKKAHDTK